MDIWTAISREIMGNSLMAVGFTNGRNKKVRVPVEQLQAFIYNNKVSNIKFNPMTCNIESNVLNTDLLETYRYSPNGRCTYIPGLSEYEVLRLSHVDEPDDILDKAKNADDALDKVKLKSKIALAIGVIGVTTAGIGAVSKSIDNISTKNIKETIYRKLNKYDKLLDAIIRAKNGTNRLIASNKNIKEYSRDLECISIQQNSIKQDILQYGILAYTRNIQQLVQVCLEPIIKYGLMDESLREFGVEGTFRVYGTSLRNKISKIRDLHFLTQTLLKENQENTENTQVANEDQHELLDNIENKLAELELSISRHEDRSSYIISDIRAQVSRIDSADKRDEYYDYLYNLESINIPKDNDDTHKKSILKQIDNIDKLINDIGINNLNSIEADGIRQYVLEEIKMIEQELSRAHISETDDIKGLTKGLKSKLGVNGGDTNA